MLTQARARTLPTQYIYPTAFLVGCAMAIVSPFPAHSVGRYFLPAARALLSGASPYAVEGFYNPPWTLLPFLPLALLPERAAVVLFYGATMAALMWLAMRWKLTPARLGAFLASLPAVYLFADGGLDALVLAGGLALMDAHPALSLLVLACKPQVTVGVVAWLLWREWRKGWAHLGLALCPLVVVTAVSLEWFGLWPVQMAGAVDMAWNVSAFPWLVPAGLFAMFCAYKGDSYKAAVSASPFFAPYVNAGSWIGVLVNGYYWLPTWACWLVTVGLWALMVVV